MDVNTLTCEARERAWKACGRPCEQVFAYLVNPTFHDSKLSMPGSSINHQMIFTDLGTILTSNGLSDPFDEFWKDAPKTNGFQIEIYYMTDKPVKEYVSGDNIIDSTMMESPLYQMLYKLEQLISSQIHGIYDVLNTKRYEFFMIDDSFIPKEHWDKFSLTSKDKKRTVVCVLLGLTHPKITNEFDGPLSKIRFVNVKLLTNNEFFYMHEHGAQKLVDLLQARDDCLISSFDRQSVV